MHQYSIDDLIGWFKDGIVWWVLSWTIFRNLVTVPNNPPAWWYFWWSNNDWYYGSDNEYHPYPQLAERFMLGVWRLLERFISETADNLSQAVLTITRALIGALPSFAASVSAWVNNVATRLGDGALYWANNAIAASQRLYDWLPVEIKVAGMSWSTLFDFVGASVRSWVTTTYNDTVSNAINAWRWVADYGQSIRTWYDVNRSWLSDLYNNFTYRVTSSLGGAWTWLVSFQSNPRSVIDALYGSGLGAAIRLANDAGTWLYNLWSGYGSVLSAFLADPGGWILQRASDEIERLW
jgi:hypothetical protein